MDNSGIQFNKDDLGKDSSNMDSIFPTKFIKTEPLGTSPNNGIKGYDNPEYYDEIINWDSEELKKNPDNKRIYYNRGNLYLKTGENEKAIADFSEFIDFDPQYARAYFKRGLAKINIGERESALLDLEKASDLGLVQADEAKRKYFGNL